METSEYQYYKGINTQEDLIEHFNLEENRSLFLNEICDFSKTILNYDRKYTPDEATVLGLMVNMHKLYVVSLNAYFQKRNEEIGWLNRMMYEAHKTMLYLIKKGTDTQRKYRLVGYHNHHTLLNEKILTDINAFYIRYIYDNRLRNDVFTIEDLNKEFSNNKHGKLHKNGFFGVHDEVNGGEYKDHYNLFYGFGSDSSHPNWYDTLKNYVVFQNGYYKPNIEFSSNDGFIFINHIASLLINSIMDFQENFKIYTDVDARKYNSVIHYLSAKKNEDFIYIPEELIKNIEYRDKNSE